jgi:Tol biopolymer transport system component
MRPAFWRLWIARGRRIFGYMALDSGTRLGPYRVVRLAGSGGMGQVYRAYDTRLERDVAIKVIAEGELVTDEQRRRFEREARATSRLSHPNICSVFDVGHEAGIDFLVLELLEGETLADRLERGPLPWSECMVLGEHIASALASAHENGILHRDLKPSNVMLTRGGPKLFDFGLAKALQTPATSDEAPRPSADLTATGLVVGTVPYMSPEQIQGDASDVRTDIFAFGAVLFEMATGRPAFSGPTPAALAAAVLTSEPPPLSRARPDAPPSLDPLIRVCLAKDPRERWHSARDVEIQLRAMRAHAESSAPARRARSTTAALPWAIAALAIGVAAVVWSRSGAAPQFEAPAVRFTIEPPPGGGIVWSVEANPLALSPDGKQLAFLAFDSTGAQGIWLRPLSGSEATPVPGTEGARSMMWSPDASALAFFTSDRLQRVDLAGGAPVTIASLTSLAGQSGTWGRDGHILFAGVQGEVVNRVAASGGTPQMFIVPDTARGEARVNWPWYLPDGDRYVYWSRTEEGGARLIQAGGGLSARPVADVESLVQYAEPGLIVFVRDGTIIGQRFDAKTGRIEGDPFAVAEGVRYFLSTGVAAVATSASGTLAFQTGQDLQRLEWLDRTGRVLGTVASTAGHLASAMSLSADGEQLLVTRQDERLGTWDNWIVDFARGTETRITTSRHTEINPLWLSDGRSVVYSRGFGAPPNLVRRDLGSPEETPLFPELAFQIGTDISPDGTTLLYRRRVDVGGFDLWTMSLVGGDRPSPWFESPGNELEALFSPDGRYVAAISDATGAPELYVAPFAEPRARTRVSTRGAILARWPGASDELIYVEPSGRVMAVRVRTNPELVVDEPVTLFTLDPRSIWTAFETSADGTRLLAAVPVQRGSEQPITVISNWAASVVR